jgi:hypothetical protein
MTIEDAQVLASSPRTNDDKIAIARGGKSRIMTLRAAVPLR